MPDKRKIIRLENEVYTEGVFLLTVCCHEKAPIFRNPVFRDLCEESLHWKATKTGVILWAYCIMPDHVHILAQPDGEGLLEFVRLFKNGVSTAVRRAGWNGEVWQRRFHDHGLRRPEKVIDVARYLVQNPVRKGFVSDWRDWKGIFIHPDLEL